MLCPPSFYLSPSGSAPPGWPIRALGSVSLCLPSGPRVPETAQLVCVPSSAESPAQCGHPCPPLSTPLPASPGPAAQPGTETHSHCPCWSSPACVWCRFQGDPQGTEDGQGQAGHPGEWGGVGVLGGACPPGLLPSTQPESRAREQGLLACPSLPCPCCPPQTACF